MMKTKSEEKMPVTGKIKQGVVIQQGAQRMIVGWVEYDPSDPEQVEAATRRIQTAKGILRAALSAAQFAFLPDMRNTTVVSVRMIS